MEVATHEVTNAEVRTIPVDEIWMDEDFNARKHITPQSVGEMAEDLYKRGLYQNPVVQELVPGAEPNAPVRAKYKTVMGHRRIEGWKLNRRQYPSEARWNAIPCKVVKPLLAHEARIMNLKENMERKDLNMMEEANSIEWFKKEGWLMGQVAKELGVSKKWVEIRFGLLALPDEIQRRAEANYLTAYQVEECIKKATREEQIQYVRNIVDHKEQGKKITAENPDEKRKRTKANALMTKGTVRSMEQMSVVQDAIQRAFKDLRHPAAMGLAFAMGVISYEELMVHIDRWIAEENDRRAENNQNPIRWTHPEVILEQKFE